MANIASFKCNNCFVNILADSKICEKSPVTGPRRVGAESEGQPLSKYIAPEGRCTVQYRVTSDNGITSGDESAQRATSDAIGTSDPVLDGTSLIRGDVLVIH